ncbi:hypothetical protein HMN09_01292300 [Mycena chlorophos]|uniref:Uncharacterized protein n=1 Tax=Mycena chlorophos TaxID=658473 RepID=A0A8H6VUA7_MYCCL|nr:hypothetical protein HMN09_01292300 [Mycena chlorophos]
MLTKNIKGVLLDGEPQLGLYFLSLSLFFSIDCVDPFFFGLCRKLLKIMHISFSVHSLLILFGIGIIGSHAAPFSPYGATLSSRAQACDAPTTCDACLAVTTAKCVFVPSSGKCQTSGNKNPRGSITSASGCVNNPVADSQKDIVVAAAAELAFKAVKAHVFEGNKRQTEQRTPFVVRVDQG